MSHLGSIPHENLQQAMMEVDLKLKEKELEQKRNLLTYPRDTSGIFRRKPLSRGTFVFQQLVVLFMIMIGIVIVYYFLH